jgi:hypothetical protein
MFATTDDSVEMSFQMLTLVKEAEIEPKTSRGAQQNLFYGTVNSSDFATRINRCIQKGEYIRMKLMYCTSQEIRKRKQDLYWHLAYLSQIEVVHTWNLNPTGCVQQKSCLVHPNSCSAVNVISCSKVCERILCITGMQHSVKPNIEAT